MSTLFLLPESRLTKSPSALDNLSAEDEYDIRVLGCELIQSSGLILSLPQTAMATAQVLFHRFYYSKSLVRYSMQHTAMACVVLASKIEESPRRIREVVIAFHKLKYMKKNQEAPKFHIDDKYVRLKDEVVKSERRILKELGFYVYVNHPHKFIVTLLQILDSTDNKQFVQTAWSYMNDALRTDVFLRYSAETIACSCVYLSARILGIPLPEEPAWWEVFSVTQEEIQIICKIILKLYTRPKPDQERLEGVIEQLKKKCERNRLNIIKELNDQSNSSTNAHQANSSAGSHQVKKVKIEHIIHDGKRHINSSIEVKEIKELKEEDRLKKSNERSNSRSPACKRSRSRSKSRDLSKRKYSSKDSRDYYDKYDNSRYDNYDSKYDSKYEDSRYGDRYNGSRYNDKYDSNKYDKYDRYDSKYENKYDSKYDKYDSRYDKYDLDKKSNRDKSSKSKDARYDDKYDSVRDREYRKSNYRY